MISFEEGLVEQQLAIVRFAMVDMEVQGAVISEQAAGVLKARGDEPAVVIERIQVGAHPDLP
jgi:hypothetical protein